MNTDFLNNPDDMRAVAPATRGDLMEAAFWTLLITSAVGALFAWVVIKYKPRD